MTKERKAINPPPTPGTPEPSIPTTRPPGPEAERFAIPATPPACAEARAIAKEGRPVVVRSEIIDKAFQDEQFQKDLQATIDENTPTWRKVFRNLFKGE